MKQFEVFENPIPRARGAYPFVAVVQSDLADTGRERIVAPLAPRERLHGTAGRLTPHVEIHNHEYVLMIPNMTGILLTDLRVRRAEIGRYRAEIAAALDYLFLGV
jgi:toxin CcdB